MSRDAIEDAVYRLAKGEDMDEDNADKCSGPNTDARDCPVHKYMTAPAAPSPAEGPTPDPMFMGLTREQIAAVQPGPCVVCGDVNYPLSCGGPALCPICDTGASSDPKRYRAMRLDRDAARAELKLVRAFLETTESALRQRDAGTGAVEEACRIGLAIAGHYHPDTPVDPWLAAHEKRLRELEAAHPAPSVREGWVAVPSKEALLGAIARGWCSPANAQKEMDADLASAIYDEVRAMLAAAPAAPSGSGK